MVLISKVLVEAHDVLTRFECHVWMLMGWGSIRWKISAGAVTAAKCGHV